MSTFIGVYKERVAMLFKQKALDKIVIQSQLQLRAAGMSQENAQKTSSLLMEILIPGEKERKVADAKKIEKELRDMMTKPIDVFMEGGAPTIVLPADMLKSKSHDVKPNLTM